MNGSKVLAPKLTETPQLIGLAYHHDPRETGRLLPRRSPRPLIAGGVRISLLARLVLASVAVGLGKKQGRLTKADDRSLWGDRWLWSCIDEDTRAITSFHLGKHRVEDAHVFVADVAKRMQKWVQISTDGLTSYMDAIEAAFGGNVDYGTIVKSFETEPIGAGRYGPPKVTSTARFVKVGK